MNKLKRKIVITLIRLLCNGKAPIEPSTAIWELIDKENQKDPNEIRCDYIEAWVEAAERVRNFQ